MIPLLPPLYRSWHLSCVFYTTFHELTIRLNNKNTRRSMVKIKKEHTIHKFPIIWKLLIWETDSISLMFNMSQWRVIKNSYYIKCGTHIYFWNFSKHLQNKREREETIIIYNINGDGRMLKHIIYSFKKLSYPVKL